MLRFFNNFKKINNHTISLFFNNNRNFLIKNILYSLKKRHNKQFLFIGLNNYDIEIILNKKISIFQILKFFKNSMLYQINTLVDIVCTDFPGKTPRISLIYVLLSSQYNQRINFFVKPTKMQVSSITKIFKNASWFEREAWDMFGIRFKNNKDLRRILTDYGFTGHPLRKDFPLTGFYELFFNDVLKSIKTSPVSLTQEYRKFNFPLPW